MPADDPVAAAYILLIGAALALLFAYGHMGE